MAIKEGDIVRGQAVDRRDLGQVLHHEKDGHKQLGLDG